MKILNEAVISKLSERDKSRNEGIREQTIYFGNGSFCSFPFVAIDVMSFAEGNISSTHNIGQHISGKVLTHPLLL